jgi:hypothetical protein
MPGLGELSRFAFTPPAEPTEPSAKHQRTSINLDNPHREIISCDRESWDKSNPDTRKKHEAQRGAHQFACGYVCLRGIPRPSLLTYTFT